ncbi:hypothetical protein [Tabrizicola sp.]|uniref:hypothetical protein n=1 Tax=Tabrizicola sp. TaxID=2005166 RepID=UPI003F30165A
MALALSMTLVQGACVATAPSAPATSEPVRVTNNGQPFQMWEGALARKVADARCGARGVNVSIYDRFDRATGEWVYPEGCA